MSWKNTHRCSFNGSFARCSMREYVSVQNYYVGTIKGPTSSNRVGVFELYELIGSFLRLSCDLFDIQRCLQSSAVIPAYAIGG